MLYFTTHYVMDELTKWFKTLLSKNRKRFLTDESLIALFREKIDIVPCDRVLLGSLTEIGLDCIVRLFVLTNE